MEYFVKKGVLSFQGLSVCTGFEEFPEKKMSAVSVSWKKSGSILLPEMM